MALSRKDGPTSGHGDDVALPQLLRLTGAKAVANASMRWTPFFFVTLGAAFGTSITMLAAIVGFGEMLGLVTLFIGGRLDRGHERAVMAVGLMAIAASGLIALHGSTFFFAIAFGLLMLGNAHVTVSGHAWISARAPFARRARFIGTFETSWAFALLLGAPAMAVLIGWFGWRGPFVAVAIGASAAAVMVWRMVDTPPTEPAPQSAPNRVKLTSNAWVLVVASAAVAMTGLTTLVVVGTWLSDSLGVSTGGIGLIAMAFGIAELVASSSSAAFADRIGKRLSTQIAMGVVLVGLLIMSLAGSSLLVGAVGLLGFFLGFEYSIVTSFSLVSEAMPEARGRALAVSSAVGTVARGAGAVLAGLLYDRFGIEGPIVLSIAAAVVAHLLLASAARREPAKVAYSESG